MTANAHPTLAINQFHALPVQVTSPADRSIWLELMQADRSSLVSQSPGWIDCICASGSYVDASRQYEMPDGRRLILPLVRLRGIPAALSSYASMPNSWGFGGLIASTPLQKDDIAAVLADLVNQPFLRLSIRPNSLYARIWAEACPPGLKAQPRLAHVLDLQGGFDEVWSRRFASNTRNKIHKAERSGVSVEYDETGRLVPAFYELFQRSIERWAKQQHEPLALARWRARRRDPIEKFQIIAQELGSACKIWMAWVDSQPAAAILVLQDANAHYTRGVMDIDLAGPTRANYLLQKLAIEAACAAGCRYYHMGESGASDSLAHFKERFGAVPVSYAEYVIERLPITAMGASTRRLVKNMIGFKDA
jgi:hypothetical protein